MPSGQLISIIVVTRNAEKYLQRCLDSIFFQKYPWIEIIIIDGASTDETISIIESNSHNIVFWKSEKDNGIYDAMNKALDVIKGSWVYFLGADDILTPDFSLLAEELKDTNCIYYGSVQKSGRKYLGRLSPYQQAKTGINHQAIIYPAKLFSVFRYDTTYPISADHVLNMQFNKNENFKFEFRDFVVAIFNDTGISSVQKDRVFEQRKGRLILKHFGLNIFLRYQFKMLKAMVYGA
ncbi:glycosyltransferase [Dyadobacter sp. CY345]|uniref:glycosyltransferase n=1 Tax=Dyadobacter sp. CY345 TaxID=2909335 RepID=UPI001F36EE81|nr:glycosyltransferase [Dyadobacter sp. CY345]MCF2447016.1 glycosyltransferase [Dyadobacter sp. CY345]